MVVKNPSQAKLNRALQNKIRLLILPADRIVIKHMLHPYTANTVEPRFNEVAVGPAKFVR